MNYIIRHTPDSRPQTVVTDRDPSDFTWPQGETVETFTDEAAFDARRAELTAPFDQADAPRQAAADQLAALRAKGWGNLTTAEKGDLVRLFFQAGG